MSEVAVRLSIMGNVLDTLQFRFYQISEKEVGPVKVLDLAQDLSIFRDALEDLAHAGIRVAFAVHEDRISKSFASLLTEIVSVDILKARNIVAKSISMTKLLVLTGREKEQEDLNSIASTVATDLVDGGIIERMRKVRELVRSESGILVNPVA